MELETVAGEIKTKTRDDNSFTLLPRKETKVQTHELCASCLANKGRVQAILSLFYPRKRRKCSIESLNLPYLHFYKIDLQSLASSLFFL